MNVSNYTNCLSGLSFPTGNILGIYDLNSGNSELIFNLKHSNANHYQNGYINASVLPLVNVGTPVVNSRFDGNQIVRLGWENSQSSWTLLLKTINSGYCSPSIFGNKYSLVSTFNQNVSSGFDLSISETHRLIFTYPSSTGIPDSYTLPQEVPQNAFIWVSCGGNQFYNFGFYDFEQNSGVAGFFKGETNKYSNIIYIGGQFKTSLLPEVYQNADFYGQINNVLFLSGSLNGGTIDDCIECFYSTGMQSVSFTGIVDVVTVTGFQYTQILENSITGYSYTVGTMPTENSNISIVYQSPLTGEVVVTETFLPLTGVSGRIYTGYEQEVPLYDFNSRMANSLFRLEFDSTLMSGDSLIVITHQKANQNLNQKMSDLILPSHTGYPLIFNNGVLETSGVDYQIENFNLISGFDLTDATSVDWHGIQVQTIDFSGLWESGRVYAPELMSPSTYFPPTSQFPQGINGEIYLTGKNGLQYDLYLNGQRLERGGLWDTGLSGLTPLIALSGRLLPFLEMDVTTGATGQVLSINSVHSNELILVPIENSGIYYNFIVNSDETSVFTGYFSGFSPQVWVNGMRLTSEWDFIQLRECSLITGFEDDYGTFDSLILQNNSVAFDLI